MNETKLTLTINAVDGKPFEIKPGLVMNTLKTSLGDKKTMSKKLPGMVGQTVEVIEYTNANGKTYIKLPQDGGFSGGGGGGRKFDNVGAEVGHAITNGVNMAIAQNDFSMETVEKFALKILELGDKLKAERKGAQAPAPQDNQPSIPAFVPNQAETPMDIARNAGLMDRILNAGMPETHIQTVYDAVGGDKGMFTKSIDKQLSDGGF